ncbi:hypothetical protein K470DRAFT_256616 [Piedraia hortae CBS 480.64]|uniref:Uncharacterized protein n=1 Tax=Piedraia hortae CBS 480.64 TaxID=1314780 RepID=A0A6A7C3D8_9PEZI|nr:hypothetical protein K470DRAFT_256616 [Piedraia hortae CBS 480.64]
MSQAQSNVGSRAIYEAGDQRPHGNEMDNKEAYHEGEKHAHKNLDSKDERSIANKLAAESKDEKKPEEKDLETVQAQKDPTLPAISHGNEPSKGAKIDKQIQEEEEELLKKKGHWGPKN